MQVNSLPTELSEKPIVCPLQYSNLSKWSEVAQSCPTLCDLWTVAHQAPPSMGFSRQEYWSGLPFPSPGDLPNPGIELRSPILQADTLTSEPPGKQNLSKEDRIPQHSHTTFIKSLIYQSSTMNSWGDSSLLNVLCKTAFWISLEALSSLPMFLYLENVNIPPNTSKL